ncbi:MULTISPECIES: dsRBD fold-containing protein [Amycolatopsis]|uniref:DUF1876 family protein n=1 Tax=Amycolatopsis dendrobii TaxID=2760662 RepID=A0A7W3VS96_9PSEU|nr:MULTISPECIES: dsRBD fold-containing protein [Amycolatopsis]MBB1152286.1 DUF1876 family protein [Amycolatopsis dendrobii]UKD57442.1 DUF1876 family protein [Amycolatopsis sp. FU40]
MTETSQRWTLAIAFDETARRTRARAVLRTGAGDEFAGTGLAHRAAEVPGLAHVAGYLAAGRALCDLTRGLLETVADDVDAAADRLSSAAPTSPAERRPRVAIRE